MKNEESQLQSACVEWFRYQYPEPKHLIFAMPNGGKRNKITAAIMKREGVRAGVPDLCIIAKSKIFFIEMKTPKGTLTLSQKEVFPMIKSNFVLIFVCRTFTEFQQTVKEMFKP